MSSEAALEKGMKQMSLARTKLAIEGGRPVRERLLPYGRQCLSEGDIAAVVEALRSDWLTQGPRVRSFEASLEGVTGARHATAVTSGTAALHAACHALGLGPGDEVIVPPITFLATANAVVYVGATPVFADVEPTTMCLDPAAVARKIGPRTKAIIGVDFAGHPAPWTDLRQIADERGLALIADAAHSLGASLGGRKVGTLADMTTLSFHPVKHVTTGEGGAVLTDDPQLNFRIQAFRSHGMLRPGAGASRDEGPWWYEMHDLGWNYRITDLQCALGQSQLSMLDAWVERRRALAGTYASMLSSLPLELPVERPGARSSWHLYPVQLRGIELKRRRRWVVEALRAEGIGAQVHYIPVHTQAFYCGRFGTAAGDCPVAEAYYEGVLSLPLFPMMALEDQNDVLEALAKVLDAAGLG